MEGCKTPTTTTDGATAEASSSNDVKLKLQLLGKQLAECEVTLQSIREGFDGRVGEEVMFRAGIMLFELRTMTETMSRD